MNETDTYAVFPTEGQKGRAKELLKVFGELKVVDNLENRIRAAERNSNLHLNGWKEVKYHGNSRGISYPSIGKKRNILNLICAGKSLGHIHAETDFKGDFETLLKQSDETVETVELFISEAETFSRKEKNKPTKAHSDNSLAGTKWAAYFLHYKEDDRIHGLYEVNEAMIGRAIVKIGVNDGKTAPVSFKNTKLDDVVDYVGHYQSHMDLDHGLVIFDLEAAGGRKRARNIHIKVYCNTPNQEILLGQYTTYERGYIQCGNIIFQNLYEKDGEELPEAEAFSFINNWENYNANHIPEAFRLFLSDRVANYNILKLPKISTEVGLGRFIEHSRPSDQSRFERFLERYEPRVFLSAPNSEATKKALERLKSTLDNEFEDKLHISFKNGDMITKARHDTVGSRQPYRDIEKLKTTRFFILLLDKPEHLSYSYLQLGIAITVCKVVIVIGKEEYMSTSINNIRSSIIKKVKYYRDLDTEWEKVTTDLIKVMKKSLPKHLGGDVVVV